jgi:hypothetical protein
MTFLAELLAVTQWLGETSLRVVLLCSTVSALDSASLGTFK